MDVDAFIRAHRPEWKRLEAATARGSRSLARSGGQEIDAVVALYQRVSGHLAELSSSVGAAGGDDLALVQTRTRDPELERYLTHVVATARGAIYGSRPRTPRDLLIAFGSHYREALARTRAHVGVAALALLGTCLVVGWWTWQSPEAQAGLLPGYAAGLEDSGSALRDPSGALSTAIFLNNVRVALLAFALGITLTVGTLWVLALNGVLIGGLAGTAVAVGTGERFFALVLPHGFLELLAIAIAAGAGLRMGWAVVAPGDLLRRDALAQAGRDAVLVAVGVVPAFAIAAAIEGLVTGVTGAAALEIAVGAGVAAGYGWLVLGRPALTASRRA